MGGVVVVHGRRIFPEALQEDVRRTDSLGINQGGNKWRDISAP